MIDPEITIGAIAKRTGLAVSAIRYYEERGLVRPGRDAGGRRRFRRSDIRRISFIRLLQGFGFTLEQIRKELARLPENRTPTEADWVRIAKSLKEDLEARIDTLRRLQTQLDGCIGCGCLSLKRCALYNPGDIAGASGSGARYLMGERPTL